MYLHCLVPLSVCIFLVFYVCEVLVYICVFNVCGLMSGIPPGTWGSLAEVFECKPGCVGYAPGVT